MKPESRRPLPGKSSDVAPRRRARRPSRDFTSGAAARNAFREIGLRKSAPTSWTQAAVVDENRRFEPMCWFGIGAEPGRQPHHTPP